MDGLQSEQEQGITIDVAYRYFSTPKRKFIIADTPGHEQYTRNMATGASTADLAIILIDARYGVQIQTKRHSFIAHLLGIKHFIVAINKMDLVDYDENRYKEIVQDYRNFAKELGILDIYYTPISALKGDTIVRASNKMLWYTGSPLLTQLEEIDIIHDNNQTDFRFPVQYVNRPNLYFRGYSGTVRSGSVKVGDSIVSLPSLKSSKVKSIATYDGDIEEASGQMAVTLTLEDEIDISRGDTLAKDGEYLPSVSNVIDACIVWMNDTPLEKDKQYYIKHNTKVTQGYIDTIYHRKDVNTLDEYSTDILHINEIGNVKIHTSQELVFDSYVKNRQMGRFIIIDRITNNTVGVGMIIRKARRNKPRFKKFYKKMGILERIVYLSIKRLFPHWWGA